MPYLVKGNAEQLFSAFGCLQFVMQFDKRDNAVNLDLARTPFLGSETQANQHLNIWSQETAAKFYTQGNQSAEILKIFLGLTPFKKAEEELEEYKRQFACLSFAYIDDKQENCGLMLMYRRDDPRQWMIGFTRKAHINPRNRPVILVSSFDLKDYIQNPGFGVTSVYESLSMNQLMTQLNATVPCELLQLVLNVERGELNPRVERINLLLRFLRVVDKRVVLADPVNLAQINLPLLFAENPALDRIIKYQVPFSAAMLQDCLSANSKLRHELEHATLSEDEHINRNLLRMTSILYEEEVINKKAGALEQNRHLLKPQVVKTFSGYMWNREQITLLPLLHRHKYPLDLIYHILSEEPYFRAVSRLAQLKEGIGFNQNVPRFFQEPQKLEALKYIDGIADEDCNLLCLVFWATNPLTIDGYKEIVAAANKYPLMASTLVVMAKKGTIPGGFSELQNLALTPSMHLKASIIYHFFSDDVHNVKNLKKMQLEQLEAVSAALFALRSAGVHETDDYRTVLNLDQKGKILRIFLPQIAAIRNIAQRQVLINVLYSGVKYGIGTQGDEILKITNQEHLVMAKKLRERFICVSQLQDLEFRSEVVAFVVRENDKRAECFRKIILCVEDQCKIISMRLSTSVSYRDMLLSWNKQEKIYRIGLYSIAYDALMDSDNAQDAFRKAKRRIKEAEKKILAIVDPKVSSDSSKVFIFISNALIFISNVVITLLSVGVLNYFKEKVTGNYWFFTQTRSGEDVRMLSKKIINSLDVEEEEILRPIC